LKVYVERVAVIETRYRIAEVASRTGFSTPTLRYYEDIGLVPPAARTDAGYRLYDDRSVERLKFIARAKQLGCTLEEITDLVEAWDRDECAPIKHRLRALVATKLDETEARIAELVALSADLRTATTALESAPLDGPCDERCGCVAEPSGPITVPLRRKSDA
jgi:DNA-binding transcriptional MerR regulator